MLALGVALLLLVLLASRFLPAYLKFRRMELAIPGPPSLPILGNSLHFLGVTEEDILTRFLEAWGNRKGLSRISLLAGRLVIFVSDALDIEKVFKRQDLQDKPHFFYEFMEDFSKRGLLTLNGSDWRVHRKAIQPAFHAEVINKYIETFADESKCFVDGIIADADTNVSKALRHAMGNAFIRTGFVDVPQDKKNAFFELLDLALRVINKRSFKPWLWPYSIFALTDDARKMKQLMEERAVFFREAILPRRQLLSKATSDEDFVKLKPTLMDVLIRDQTLTESEMMDEFTLFFAAATETSASSLGWVLKVLSVRPDVQAKLHTEVTEVLGGRAVTKIEDIDKLQYMGRVIQETMRLLPSIPFIGRGNRQETEFEGYQIPAESAFFINIISVQRDPTHWPDPLRFDPDRFLPERSEGRHPYAYLPFSVGRRNCIGHRYAIMIMKTCLATIVQRLSIGPVPDGHTEPHAFPMTFDISSKMPDGFRVVFSERVGWGSRQDAH